MTLTSGALDAECPFLVSGTAHPPLHADLVHSAIGAHSQRWRKLETFPRIDTGGRIELWELLPVR